MKKTIFQKYFNSKTFIASAIALALITGCSYQGKRNIAEDGSGAQSAFDIYSQLQESATSFNTKAVMVNGDMAIDGMEAGVTWGAEKEASSALITRVMGPPDSSFASMVSGLSEENRKAFLSDFLHNYTKNANAYRTFKTEQGVRVDLATDVTDFEGNAKLIDMDQLRGIDYQTADLSVLEEKWAKWLEMTQGKPMSFVKPSVQSKLFKGQLPGLDSNNNIKKAASYTNWVPNFGPAEKYVRDSHGHGGGVGGGWEINFKPMQTYGEFEEMVAWFRTTLKNTGKLFQAPGHQRMVFVKHPNLDEAKLSEVYKAIQALIVVDGIQGKTGIEKANYKQVQSDSGLASLYTSRGVIRLEKDRWASNTHAVEFRAGTKDIRAARFYQTVLASRVATNDFSGIADVGDWTLNDGQGYNAQKLAQKFDVSEEVAQRAIDNISTANIKPTFVLPFWNWTDENNPFLGTPKRKFLKSLTKDFILQMAEVDGNHEVVGRELMRRWTKSSNLGQELRQYLKPKRGMEMTEDLLHFNPPSGRALVANAVDVNNIDLGIEYSGRLPLRLDANFTQERLADGQKAWLSTNIDINPTERESLIRQVAKDLGEELGSNAEPVKITDADGHGHGLELAYEVRDSQNRKWIVEWDGIGRSYDSNGDVIEGSARAGSIEIPTPKFVPEPQEMDAVFKAMAKNNVMPNLMSGGGHINIDLAAFEGKPKQLARFMSIFHEHRGVIALMFQHVNRSKAGEPIDISPNLSQKLKNFEGTEEELKKLLYNEQYFNTRYGRKSRYIQLEMSSYFQDVIPEEFITEDFDIKSPTDPWRRQFRVDPNIRKAEFRMFNAPRDAAESALQIRLVKAMLSKALNEDGALSGTVQKVDHLAYLNDTDKAYSDLQKMCDDLGLNIDDYRPAVAEGISDTDLASRSIFFETLEQKLTMHPKQPAWGQAVDARSADNAIGSEGRHWEAGPADQQNTMTHAERIRAIEQADAARDAIVPDRVLPGQFRRTDSCLDAVGPFI
ncbi:MAG: hypothetical protein CME70_19595 [Halobacteriovorax sp.]|nr:hypothetical protein [Halobacteriovorax sp.]|tara:strand:+ start:6628 stop:9648 length:3021 start_codon:yes stop_codon:yes gene_type:complete